MRPDITELMSFYDAPLGQFALRTLAGKLTDLWGSLEGLDVLGMGYAPPLLEQMSGSPRRMIAHMPPAQGGVAWKASERGFATTISRDHKLPFPDAMFDRVLLVHSLEETRNAFELLKEVWRVSAPEARIVIIVPNRSGYWSLTDATPFGHGRPYTLRQLRGLMRDVLLEPTAWTRALYMPPVSWRIFTSSAEGWERAGEIFLANLGGVNLIEGRKRIHIEPAKRNRIRVIVPRPIGSTARTNPT